MTSAISISACGTVNERLQSEDCCAGTATMLWLSRSAAKARTIAGDSTCRFAPTTVMRTVEPGRVFPHAVVPPTPVIAITPVLSFVLTSEAFRGPAEVIFVPGTAGSNVFLILTGIPYFRNGRSVLEGRNFA